MLIIIPLVVMGIFLVLDEREQANKVATTPEPEQQQEHEQPLWEDVLRERWENKTMADLINNIVILQRSVHSVNTLLQANRSALQTIPQQIAFHLVEGDEDGSMLDQPELFIRFNMDTQWNEVIAEVMGDWLDVSGAQAVVELDVFSGMNFEIKFSDFGEQPIRISIYGLPDITLVPMEPLTYRLLTEQVVPPFLYIENQQYYFDAELILTSDTTFLDYQFSEQMVGRDKIGTSIKSVAGEWLTEDTYRFYVTPFDTHYLDFGNIYSIRGNHLAAEERVLHLRWHDANSSWVNFTSQDAPHPDQASVIYNGLIFAPNERDYLGIIVRYAELGHRYSVVYHKQGEKPQFINQFFYGPDLNRDLPIHWLNDHEFLVFSFQEIAKFNTESLVSEPIYQVGEQSRIQAVHFDELKGELFLYELDQQDPDSISDKHGELKLSKLILATGKVEATNLPTLPYYLLEDTFHGSPSHSFFNMVKHDAGLFLPYHSAERKRMTLWQTPTGELKHIEGHPQYKLPEGILLQDNSMDHEGYFQEIWWVDQSGKRTKLELPRGSVMLKVGTKLVKIVGVYYYDEDEGPEGMVFEPSTLSWREIKNIDNLVYRSLPMIIIPPYVKESDLSPFLREVLELN